MYEGGMEALMRQYQKEQANQAQNILMSNSFAPTCHTNIKGMNKLRVAKDFTDQCKMELIKEMVKVVRSDLPLSGEILNYNLEDFKTNNCFKNGKLSVSTAVQNLIVTQCVKPVSVWD